MSCHRATRALPLAALPTLALLALSIPGARAFDESKYPDWKGQWVAVDGGGGTVAWDPTLQGMGERALLTDREIDLLITKDSGGDATEAKLTAARERGLPVIVVDRPPAPKGVQTAASVDEMLSLLSADSAATLRRGPGGPPI